MKRRDPFLTALFIIITFGIYGLYWTCSTQNQIKRLTNQGVSGGIHLLLSIVTFGIYSIYWYCVVDTRLINMGAPAPNRWWLYLLLMLTGFASFIVPGLIQDKANKTVPSN